MPSYDGFLSYSHDGQEQLARRLQEGVERFGKPWYRARSLRLFLDKIGLTAAPDLWATIEAALANSRWFIVVCSPHAATSPWIDREIRWWLEHRSTETLLIVRAAGELRWDKARGDFDPDASTALPAALLGAFDRVPHWIEIPSDVDRSASSDEPSLREVIIDVAAPLQGVSKERLAAAAERERRRTMRWVAGTIAILVLLLIAAGTIGVIALNQRDAAVAQANLALSRQIAAASEAAAGTNLPVAMLLAVQAYRTDANAQTRAALFDADTTSPKLVRFIDAGGTVKELAGSANGRSAVAALADGRVLFWKSLAQAPSQPFRLPRTPSSVAIDREGDVMVASDASRCVLWRRGHQPERLPVPTGLHCDAAALSPSGETVVYQAGGPNEMPASTITVASVADLAHRAVHPNSPTGASTIVVPDDHRVLLDSGGAVTWRNFFTWTGPTRDIGVGARDYEYAVSADGGYFIVSNGANQVPILKTVGPANEDAAFQVEAPLARQTTLALSPDGSELAVAGPGEIYVAPDHPDLQEQEQPEGGRSVLSGQSAELVTFANDRQLLSAAGREIGVWDTGQLDRLAHAENVPLEPTCELCSDPKVSVSPDGRRVAVVPDNASNGFVQSLDGHPDREPIRIANVESPIGTPVWDGRSNLVALPLWTGEANLLVASKEWMPRDARAWEVVPDGGEGYELTEGHSADGRSAYLIDETGAMVRQRIDDGQLTGTFPDPWASKDGEGRASSAAISPSGRLLAISYADGVRVERLPHRELVSRVPSSDSARVAFAGDRLLVLDAKGQLQIWDAEGDEREGVIANAGGGWLAGSPDGRLAALSNPEEGTIRLFDLELDAEVAAFKTPVPISLVKTGIALSSQGPSLIAVSETLSEDTGVLVRRDLSDTSLISTACAAAGSELTAGQWRSFVGTTPPRNLSCR